MYAIFPFLNKKSCKIKTFKNSTLASLTLMAKAFCVSTPTVWNSLSDNL